MCAAERFGHDPVGNAEVTIGVTAPNGQPVTVYPLLNSAAARRFVRTNGDGFFSRYNGLMLSLSRRLANRWAGNVNYTYSAAEGLQPTGTVGRATRCGASTSPS